MMSILESTVYDWTWFNGLPEVEVADMEMRATDRLSVALSALAPIFLQHGVCDAWGLGLLHKHWLLEAGERPIQNVVCHNGDVQFETRPGSLDPGGKYLPSILAVTCDGALHAIEFSADPQVRAAHDVLRGKPGFVSAFCRAVVANGLRSTFGLVASKLIEDEDGLVEFNYAGRLSVLRRTTPADPRNAKYIQTSWRFAADASGIDCHARCLSRCETKGDQHETDHPFDHGVDT
jgi:hypothetical protein